MALSDVSPKQPFESMFAVWPYTVASIFLSIDAVAKDVSNCSALSFVTIAPRSGSSKAKKCDDK